MSDQNPNDNQNEREEPIVNDKRRIDPETGKVRGEGSAAADAEVESDASGTDSAPAGDEAAEDLPTISEDDLNSLLEEAMQASTASDSQGDAEPEPANEEEHSYLTDLKRVQAEYANFRRRTEREKEELAALSTAKAAKQLLPVLDDLDRADAAGDLPEGSSFQVIASKLRAAIERLGVVRYGEKGEPFDPQQHEAIAQLPNPEVTEATIADVVEVGYRIGDREIRAAKVAVFVPAS
ncbi:nucleotide exchange factor GrpE [Gulosibacter sp. ACHW.36C]|uniref:Protein GrpE n=1 Tax=Gulosibacter sediminis TaxID=1729695 RepID=A0ABY4MYB1_9MICO|nr:nucleotide exchange factor GrpE [Gulosibacter sediminis]UQN14695.1 nucleotide exchange factor GrpE [Gulosibacter sediminis]